jgi:hypothetical protein
VVTGYNPGRNQKSGAFMEPAMGSENLFEGIHWLVRHRRRRFRIGDLMVAIAMTAIGFSAVSLPGLTGGERLLLGVVAVAFLGLLWAQWGLASIPSVRARPSVSVLVGVISSLMALSMFVCLVLLGLVYPQGAALLSVMMLLQVVYLTTWE